MTIEDKQERTPPAADNPGPQVLKDNRDSIPSTEAGKEPGTGTAVSNGRRSRVSKTVEKRAGAGDPSQQPNVAAKPERKARAQVQAAEAAEPSQAEPPVPKRTRRRASPSLEATKPSAQATSQSAAPERHDIPVITEEAIAFLANPEAKVPDLFKLRPQSREFVLYHVSNMQRLDAEIASGRSYLATHMPKFSPEFEKAADALLTKLAKQERTVSKKVTPDADKSASTDSVHFYGPRQVIEVAQIRPASRVVVGAKAHDGEVENTIERGPLLEVDKQPAIDSPRPTPAEVADGKSMPGLGKKVLQIVGSRAHVAGAWLQRKATQAGTTKGAAQTTPPGTEPAPRDEKAKAVPASVARRFLKVETDYFFPNKTHAFSDRGDKLATRGTHPEVVRSLVEIAQARGWSSITVKGTEEFRRSAWMEAAQAGLKVTGYQPTALDLAELANRPANNTVEKGRAPSLAKDPVTPSAQLSGERSERPKAEQRERAGALANAPAAPIAELVAKASAFEKEKASFVLKNHPDLAPAYGVVEVARKFAEAHLPEDAREEFVGLARRHVIQKIVTGEIVKGPKIYVEHAKSRKAGDRMPEVANEAIDQSMSPRAKEVAKER